MGEYLPKVGRENGGFLLRSGAGETMRKLSGWVGDRAGVLGQLRAEYRTRNERKNHD